LFSPNLQAILLLVIFEDLHWVDEPSKAMLDFLFKTLNLDNRREGNIQNKILFILSFRPEFQVPDSYRFNTDLAKIDLRPLSVEDCNLLLKLNLKDIDLSKEKAEELLEKSEGNPFYLEEWINLLKSAEEGMDDILKHPVPNSLTALMLSRIDRLQKDVKLLLQKASVYGKHFTEDVLVYIENQLNRIEVIDDQLDQLLDSGFISIEDNVLYSFKHAITCDVSYNTLLIANRRILHRLIAEFMEIKYSDNLTEMYPSLSFHYGKAEETEKAIFYLNKAVEKARRNFDTENALIFYNSLLSIYGNLLDSTPEKDREGYIVKIVNTILKKGDCLEPMGKWDECEEMYNRALKLADDIDSDRLTALVKCNIGVIRWRKGNIETAIDTLNDALTVFEKENDRENTVRTILNIGNINLFMGNYDKAITCYEKVIDYYETAEQSEHKLSLYMGNLGIACSYKGQYSKAEEYYSKQLEICERLGDRHGIATVTANMGELFRNTNNLKKAMECYNRAHNLFEEMGDVNRCGIITGNIGIIFYQRGEFENAISNYRMALETLENSGDKYHRALFTGNLAIAYMNMKDGKIAEETFSHAIELTEEIKSSHLLTYWLVYQAENLFVTGQIKKAFSVVARARRLAKDIGNNQPLFLSRILSAKIDFELTEGNDNRKNKCIEPLLRMLSESESTIELAAIHYELAVMFWNIGLTEPYKEHRELSLSMLKELLAESEYFEWRRMMESLESETY